MRPHGLLRNEEGVRHLAGLEARREEKYDLGNERARDLWGLSAEEARGQHLMNLDIGLEVGRLKVPLRKCLTGASEKEQLTLEAVNRRGKRIECVVTCAPLMNESGIHGALVLMEDAALQA